MRARGHRWRGTCVLLPGPQPRSITARGDSTAMRDARSAAGRVRSSPNLRYSPGSQGMAVSRRPPMGARPAACPTPTALLHGERLSASRRLACECWPSRHSARPTSSCSWTAHSCSRYDHATSGFRPRRCRRRRALVRGVWSHRMWYGIPHRVYCPRGAALAVNAAAPGARGAPRSNARSPSCAREQAPPERPPAKIARSSIVNQRGA